MLRDNKAWWAGLRQLLLGAPTISMEGDNANRYRCILTRVQGGHVLHIIDSAVTATDYLAQDVTITLAARRLGDPQQAIVLESNASLPISRDGDRIGIVVRPDPVASVVMK